MHEKKPSVTYVNISDDGQRFPSMHTVSWPKPISDDDEEEGGGAVLEDSP